MDRKPSICATIRTAASVIETDDTVISTDDNSGAVFDRPASFFRQKPADRSFLRPECSDAQFVTSPLHRPSRTMHSAMRPACDLQALSKAFREVFLEAPRLLSTSVDGRQQPSSRDFEDDTAWVPYGDPIGDPNGHPITEKGNERT